MRFDASVFRAALHPAWVSLVLGAALLAGIGGLWVGLQQDAGETSTTFVYARRVGFLDRPLPELESHLNEIINSVEFPEVFERIENRLLLQADRDYDLEIGLVEDTQSLVQIVVETNRSGESDRISRIVAEEMVSFVLAGQDQTVQTEIIDLDNEIERLGDEQVRLVADAGGVPPNQLEARIEAELAGFASGALNAPAGEVTADLREQLSTVQPLATTFDRNVRTIRVLNQQRAQSAVDQLDITSGRESINEEWYRAITPPEPTSNVPVAIAMGFAAGIPALFAAAALVLLNVSRRLTKADRHKQRIAEQVVPEQQQQSAAVSA